MDDFHFYQNKYFNVISLLLLKFDFWVPLLGRCTQLHSTTREGGREGCGISGVSAASQRKYLRGFLKKCQRTPSSHIKEAGNYC